MDVCFREVKEEGERCVWTCVMEGAGGVREVRAVNNKGAILDVFTVLKWRRGNGMGRTRIW